jgi:hypothetical protein
VSLHQSPDHVRNAVVASALLAVVAVIWIVYRHSAPQSLPQPSLAALKSELDAIRPPAGYRLEMPTAEEAKIGLVQVTHRFELQQPAAEARAHFRAQLCYLTAGDSTATIMRCFGPTGTASRRSSRMSS